MPAVKLTHYFTHLRSLGGVQSILFRHLANDGKLGFDTTVGVFFEGMEPAVANAYGTGWTGWDSIRSARQTFNRLPTGADVAVYHNFWGIPFTADLDLAGRRIGYLHSHWPGINDSLRAQRGLVDGVICVSEPLRELAMEQLPELDKERVVFIPIPITPPAVPPEHAPMAGRPVVLGYNGRVSREQKRVDRFLPLVRRLEESKLSYRLEFLGEGPELAWLKTRFSENPNVIFHGRQSGESYRTILRQWDFIAFTSDYEGLPISLLEALATGVLPIFPSIGSGGDSYAAGIRPDLLYRPEDFATVAAVIRQLQQLPAAEMNALQKRGQKLVEPHYQDAYFNAFGAFVNRIRSLPRLAGKLPHRPAYFTDWWPFGLLRRAYMRGFYRRPETTIA